MREFMIYSSTSVIDDKVARLQSAFPCYEFQWYAAEDPAWEGYQEWVE